MSTKSHFLVIITIKNMRKLSEIWRLNGKQYPFNVLLILQNGGNCVAKVHSFVTIEPQTSLEIEEKEIIDIEWV